MNKLIKYLVVTAILYLIFSFLLWQLNPSMWTTDARGMFVFMWVACMVLIPMINGMMESMKD